MRVVLDTNVLVSALLSPRGSPAAILRRVFSGELEAVTTQSLLDEFVGVILRPHLLGRLDVSQVDAFVVDFLRVAAFVTPAPVPAGSVRDPADEAVLAAAVGGNADVIVTGDEDLLTLGTFEGVTIVTPSLFLQSLG